MEKSPIRDKENTKNLTGFLPKYLIEELNKNIVDDQLNTNDKLSIPFKEKDINYNSNQKMAPTINENQINNINHNLNSLNNKNFNFINSSFLNESQHYNGNSINSDDIDDKQFFNKNNKFLIKSKNNFFNISSAKYLNGDPLHFSIISHNIVKLI